MKKKHIIIPVETKSREFYGKLFLSLHFLKKGFPVLFGDQSKLWNYCDLVNNSVYIDKSIASTRVEWFSKCEKIGHEICSWDEEGLVFFEPWMYRKLRIDSKALDKAKIFFAWGEVQRDAILDEYHDVKYKIILSGNPRFDFLRKELRIFYKDKVEFLKRRFGKIILVNTNFAFYNHFKTQEELRSMLALYPLSGEIGYLDGWIAMHRDAHHAYLAMVPELIKKFPEHTIILRPHPSESHAPWKELANKHQRLHVDSTGNVHEWILASEAVIHFNCTTAVEAYLLGVPPIAYRPKRYPRYENPLPYALSENTFSLNELWLALAERKTARERGVLWTKEQDLTVQRHISGFTGKTAAQTICEEIINRMDCLYSSEETWQQGGSKFIKRLWRIILHKYRERCVPSDGYNEQKFPDISSEEINQALFSMMNASGITCSYSISFFAKNCYLLSPAESGQ